jgi:hypothetical protein
VGICNPEEGFVTPATQHDALVWLSGSAYDVVFDMARTVIRAPCWKGQVEGRDLKLGIPA